MNTTYTAGATGFDSVNIDDLLATVKRMRAEKRKVDDGLVAAITDYLAQTGMPVPVFATLLGVSEGHLTDVLASRSPPSASLWDGVRVVFEPLARHQVTTVGVPQMPRQFPRS